MKTKSKVAFALSVLFVVLAVAGYEGTFSAKLALAKSPQVVVRLECGVGNSDVVSIDGSVGAPALSLSTPCAQAIADVLDRGFKEVSAEESSFVNETYTVLAAVGVQAPKPEHDVLRVVCSGSGLLFQDGSAGAPLVTGSCSQALAEAVNHRFTLPSTEGIYLGAVTAYTLVRTQEK